MTTLVEATDEVEAVEVADEVEAVPPEQESSPDPEYEEMTVEALKVNTETTPETTAHTGTETETTGNKGAVIVEDDKNAMDCLEVESGEKAVDAMLALAKSNEDEEKEMSQNEPPPISFRDEESEKLGKEIFFNRNGNPNYCGWDNLVWMSYSGTRQITLVASISRFVPGRRTLFWSGDQYLERVMVVYTEPPVILILRPPLDMNEVLEILDLPQGSSAENADDVFKTYLVVESVIDPKTCKLKLSPLTTVTAISYSDTATDDPRRRSCFELVTPMENIVLSAVRLRKGAERPLSSFTDSGAFLETTRTEHVLQKSICDAHRPEQGITDLSWQHQVILGTLHSHVVLGNQTALNAALSSAKSASSDPHSEYVEPKIIDAVDESGRTPLHYACSARFASAVSALVKAGANVDLRVEPYNWTACHLAALNLDSQSLEIILSVNRRPSVVDSWGRTPIYLSIIEGRSVGGAKDPEALERCLSVLEAHGAEIDPPLGFPHPVSSLASTWSHGELEATLKHVAHKYPLVVNNVKEERRVGISVSALFHYPVHSSLIALRNVLADDQGAGLNASSENEICRTLEVLLNCGFEPNERLEGLMEVFEGMDDLAAHVGFAPTQILGATALDAMQQRNKLGDALYLTIMKIISGAMFTLVSHGGRLGLDPPPSSRPKARDSLSISGDSLIRQRSETKFTSHDPFLLKLQDNKNMIDLLGDARLKSAEKSWNNMKTVTAGGSFIFHTDKLPIENSEAPGGSDVKSCAICWSPFGTITNRKHRCRISRRHICQECSSKSISDGKEEHRVSDGQFLLGRNIVSKSQKQVMARKPSTTTTQRPSGFARLESKEAADRETLFGNVMGTMAKAVFGDDEQSDANRTHAESVEGLSHSLNQTRNQLNERGQKLNTLAEKSDRLVNASKDFASMAKELNRQSQGGFFW